MFFVEDPRWRDALVAGGGSDGVAALQAEISRVKEDMKKKADSITYDSKTRKVQLKSGDDLIGSTITVPSDDYADQIPAGDGEEWSDMDESGTKDNGEEWSDM